MPDYGLAPVDHDPFDPTGLVGPTQEPGQSNVFEAFMAWRDSGQSWADRMQAAEGNPRAEMELLGGLTGPAGMARPVTPPGFAENLARLATKGMSGSKIAQELGVSKATVQRGLSNLSIARQPTSVEAGIWSDPRNVDTLLKMHESGASDKQIADELGAVRGSIQLKRQRMGLEANNPPGGYGTQNVFGMTAPMGRPPSMPQTSVPNPGVPGDAWLMKQLGYSDDAISQMNKSGYTIKQVDHDPFREEK